VIDPELSDELRVTVVATGIGQAVSLSQSTPGNETTTGTVRGGVTAKPVAIGDKRPDYSDYELPAVTRMARERRSTPAITSVASGQGGAAAQGLDYLDIPAFLRRQAD
jgi:cell division protein FtsZ